MNTALPPLLPDLVLSPALADLLSFALPALALVFFQMLRHQPEPARPRSEQRRNRH